MAVNVSRSEARPEELVVLLLLLLLLLLPSVFRPLNQFRNNMRIYDDDDTKLMRIVSRVP